MASLHDFPEQRRLDIRKSMHHWRFPQQAGRFKTSGCHRVLATYSLEEILLLQFQANTFVSQKVYLKRE